MKVLLDEMFPPAVARALRERGHDAIAVAERPDLVALGDPELFAAAQAEQRAVVTENVADFMAIDARYRADGEKHFGPLFVLKSNLPRNRAQFVGAMTGALDNWLAEHHGVDVPSLIAWP